MTTPSPIATRALALADSKIGAPYVWGTAGPDSFDCSGLVDWSFRHAGFPWQTRMDSAHQITVGQPVKSPEDLILGDLVRPFVGHIQMYAGAGKVIEATGGPDTIPVREHEMYGFHDACRLVPAVEAHPAPQHPVYATLHRGCRGVRVGQLQRHLNAVYPAYSHLVVDNIYGPATEAVVREFQKRSRITVDGIVGPVTAGKLGLA